MAEALAIKYRPKSFEDVTEQTSVKDILMHQLETQTTLHAYLFCGGAGTGKTTCARIFANEINKGEGTPIEIDAASNNSVDDVRSIIAQARTQSLDSEYKVFIIDECHMISNAGWNAFLKVLEEPPIKSVFIMCTTDPQKIPKTILSRVQRYDFQRISHQGICDRLLTILGKEFEFPSVDSEAINYIAKIADGGMRDAITTLDKCLAYSTTLTLESVVKALGTTNYDIFFNLTEDLMLGDHRSMLDNIESAYASGKDLKKFIKDYLAFVLDVCKYDITGDFKLISVPNLYKKELDNLCTYRVSNLVDCLLKLHSDLKWETNPRMLIECTLLLFNGERNDRADEAD